MTRKLWPIYLLSVEWHIIAIVNDKIELQSTRVAYVIDDLDTLNGNQ